MIVRKTRYNFAASKSYADCGKRNTKEVFECSDCTEQKGESVTESPIHTHKNDYKKNAVQLYR